MKPAHWRWMAVGMMMAVTFLFGTDAFSSENTRSIIRWIMEFLFGPRASEMPLGTGEGWLRKSAHFVEYAMLAFLWWRALSHDDPLSWRWLLFAWLFTVGWAAVDELQQAYVSTQRTGTFADVVLDSAGALTAMLCVAVYCYLKCGK